MKYTLREVGVGDTTVHHLFRYEEERGLPNNAELEFWLELQEARERIKTLERNLDTAVKQNKPLTDFLKRIFEVGSHWHVFRLYFTPSPKDETRPSIAAQVEGEPTKEFGKYGMICSIPLQDVIDRPHMPPLYVEELLHGIESFNTRHGIESQ